jgi:hypothetical protein
MATTPATAVRWSLVLALAASSLACHPPRRPAVAVRPSPPVAPPPESTPADSPHDTPAPSITTAIAEAASTEPAEPPPLVISRRRSTHLGALLREEDRHPDPVIPEGYSTVPPGLLEPARQFVLQHQRLYHVVSDNRGTRCQALTFQERDGAVTDPYQDQVFGRTEEIRSTSPYRFNQIEYGWTDIRTGEERRHDQVSLGLSGPFDQRRTSGGSWSTFRIWHCERQAAIVDVEPAALVFIPGGGLIRGYHPSVAQRLYTEAAACEASLPVVRQQLATHERTPDQFNLGC